VTSKPTYWSADYAAQFQDPAVVAAYPTRPRYPDEVFEILESLLPPGRRRALELGCGTGDLTLGLAKRVESVDALDVSVPMIEAARARAGASHSNVTWILSAAERFEPSATYSLIAAGESLHWMDWDVVLPACARWLEPAGWLAIANGRILDSPPWQAELESLIRRHSTNRDFKPTDLVAELEARGLFRQADRRRTAPVAVVQSVDEYVESFHSRNGFSRDRMTPESAAAFDESLRSVVASHCPDGVVRASLRTHLVWGRPLSG
jgi:ubiquinone/menaquinone biosynthesis C-methylase UbiE